MVALCLLASIVRGPVAAENSMELEIDHVMFPVYANNPMLETIESIWNEKNKGKVYTQPQNENFKGVYLGTRSFYVEYLSTVASQPYWSNAVYVVVPTEYWSAYENPALRTEHFLVPWFGSGFQLVSPDYPYLNKNIAGDEDRDGLTILISPALEKELLSIGGQKWALPANGKVKVHDGLAHLHDIVVIDSNEKLIAPLLEANPVLRDFF
jgi:hypothetical protein